MSENNFLPFLIKGTLYLAKEPANKVYEANTETTLTVKEPEELLSNKLLILTPPLTDQTKTLLINILSAIKLKEGDYEICEDQSKSPSEFIKALIFEDQNNSNYQVRKDGNTEIMNCIPLNQLDQSKVDKTKLWKALKDWFSV